MYCVSIDPSSTAIGWTIYIPGQSMEDPFGAIPIFGVFRPNSRRKPYERMEDIAQWAKEWEAHPIDRVLIEVPSGAVNHGRNRGGGAGLSVYGFAAGVVWSALSDLFDAVVPIKETWTGGFTKAKRQSVAARHASGYDPKQDKGGDAADAICMAIWYHHMRKGEKHVAA